MLENARIKAVMLGFGDHGEPTLWITCEQGSTVQGYGGIDLRAVDFAKMLLALLRVCGAREWDHLKGKYVRIERDKNEAIARLGHIINDDWLEWREFVNQRTPGDAK